MSDDNDDIEKSIADLMKEFHEKNAEFQKSINESFKRVKQSQDNLIFLQKLSNDPEKISKLVQHMREQENKEDLDATKSQIEKVFKNENKT